MRKKRRKRKGRSRHIRYRMEYAFVRLMEAVVCLLPPGVARALGRLLGFLAFSLFRIRREVTLGQLKAVFGKEYSERERVAIGRRAYENFAMTVVEFSRFPVCSPGEILEMVEMEGREHLDRALEGGKGAILVAGHFGNWELMGAALRAAGYPVNFLVGRQHNGLVDRRMNEYRRMMDIGIIPRGIALRGVIHALRKNQFVAMLSDQDARRQGIFVNFLGRKASTPQGAAVFARKVGCPIIVGSSFRGKRGAHRIVLAEPVVPPVTENKARDIRLATQRFTDLLSGAVRQQPDHWFWPHRRWKTVPVPGREERP